MTVGNKIRLARKRAEMTIGKAAKALDLTPYRLQMYEHDDLQLPPRLAVSMAELYGIDLNEICDDDGTFLRVPVSLDKGALAPIKRNCGSGFDILSPHTGYIGAGKTEIIDTGIHLALPAGFCAAVVSCPALTQRYGITAEGMYERGSGSLKVILSCRSDSGFCYQEGYKIAELLILPSQLTELEPVGIAG